MVISQLDMAYAQPANLLTVSRYALCLLTMIKTFSASEPALSSLFGGCKTKAF